MAIDNQVLQRLGLSLDPASRNAVGVRARQLSQADLVQPSALGLPLRYREEARFGTSGNASSNRAGSAAITATRDGLSTDNSRELRMSALRGILFREQSKAECEPSDRPAAAGTVLRHCPVATRAPFARFDLAAKAT